MERARSARLARGSGPPELFGAEQLRILERIARGAPLDDVLCAIVSLIEHHTDGLCSILRLDAEHGTLRHAAAPSLPAAYIKAIDGSRIGPTAGSCGSAAYLVQRVIVADIAMHPFWNDYRQLALPFGLRAC